MNIKEGVVCHAPGDRCHGCDHYEGKADECVFKGAFPDGGGPAFPANESDEHTGERDGMTLRDFFAAKALQGAIASPDPIFEDMDSEDMAAYAYSLADAMLRKREAV